MFFKTPRLSFPLPLLICLILIAATTLCPSKANAVSRFSCSGSAIDLSYAYSDAIFNCMVILDFSLCQKSNQRVGEIQAQRFSHNCLEIPIDYAPPMVLPGYFN